MWFGKVAMSLKMEVEEMERLVVGQMEKEKGVVGVRAVDCVLGHPEETGRVILKVAEKSIRYSL